MAGKKRLKPLQSPKPSPVPEAREQLSDKESPKELYPGKKFPHKVPGRDQPEEA